MNIDIYITNYYKTNKQVHILKQKTLHIYISKQLILIIKKKMEVYNYTILEEECDIDVNEKTAVEHITISSEQCHYSIEVTTCFRNQLKIIMHMENYLSLSKVVRHA